MAKIKNFLPSWLKPEWALLVVVLLVLLVPVLLTQGGRAVPEAKKALDGITGKDTTTSTTGSGTTTHPGDRPVYVDTMTVFFGHALAGDNLPNLTYMLWFRDYEERDLNWQNFIDHPDWKEISSLEAYKNTVSSITRIFLEPLAISSI